MNQGCSSLYRNDYLHTLQLTDSKQPELICKVYQTGIDNYRYEFKLTENGDTTELFDAYLNDASQTEDFMIEESSGHVGILSHQNLGNTSKTVRGVRYDLIHID